MSVGFIEKQYYKYIPQSAIEIPEDYFYTPFLVNPSEDSTIFYEDGKKIHIHEDVELFNINKSI